MKVSQLSALLEAQQSVIEKISLGAELSECLNTICENIESILDSPNAKSSILLLKGNQLHHGAAPSLPEGYCQAIDGVVIGPNVGSCGTAAFTHKQIIVRDIETDPLWADFKKIALGYGLRSCWSSPILSSHNKVLGTFAIYDAEISQPDETDLDLIARFTHLSGFAIEKKQIEEEVIELQSRTQHQQKMEALGQLTGGIAHDFNNVLAIIQGYTELLHTELASFSKLSNYTNQIQRAADRGSKLTKKLLSFTRKKPIESREVDINSLIKEQKDVLQKTLTVQVKLNFELGENIWPISLDYSDLEDAIINMSINASHAMKNQEQEAILTMRTDNISLSSEDAKTINIKAGDYVRLVIEDTGCGMEDTTIKKIFEPFFSTKGNLGSGLGLSQVFGFVSRANGAIKVESSPGHGSRFTLYFPRYAGHDKPSAVKDNNVNQLAGKESILVVDDEEALLDLAHDILIDSGYQVYTANSGEKALAILKQHSINLLISDILMPQMNGFQLAAMVKKKFPSVKIQLTSGYSDTTNLKEKDIELHQNAMSKPYSMQTLLERVRELLDHQ